MLEQSSAFEMLSDFCSRELWSAREIEKFLWFLSEELRFDERCWEKSSLGSWEFVETDSLREVERALRWVDLERWQGCSKLREFSESLGSASRELRGLWAAALKDCCFTLLVKCLKVRIGRAVGGSRFLK